MCDFLKPLWKRLFSRLQSSKTLDQSTTSLLQALHDDPKNDALLAQLRPRIFDTEEFASALKDVFAPSASPSPDTNKQSTSQQKLTWRNWLGDQICHPTKILYPKTLPDLISAIKQANSLKTTVRCVGSGHSFSDVALTDGILLETHGLDKVLPIDTNSLLNPADAEILFAVEAGITLRKLNETLDSRSLGLLNMGSYDAQTLAGAISTGTHGTGAKLGPMSAFVRAVTIVDSQGKVYQLEPSGHPITNPEKWRSKEIELKQSDEWFQTVVVGMGCVGLIYSYIIEVRNAYMLEEDRVATTWERLKPQLVPPPGQKFPKLMTENRHFEVDVNPYSVGGAHSAIQVTKNVSTNSGALHGGRGLINWVNGLLAGWDVAQHILATFLNAIPWTSPDIINKALNTLVNSNYIDKSYRVFNVGIGDVEATALELSIPFDGWIGNVDRLMAIFEDEAKSRSWFLAGPIALRFVEGAEAYLSPQQGRDTVMAELTMLYGVDSGKELVKAVKERICTPGSGIRVHWGLDLDTVRKDEAREMYPMWKKWEDTYKVLNATGVFDGRVTERLGISIGKRG